MMNKTKSYIKQPKVAIKIMSDGIAWVYINLNEQQLTENVTQPDGTTQEQDYFEYDYTEFHAPKDELDLDDIKANPENYADYEPIPKATAQEKIEAQVMYTALMTDTLLEEG